MSRNLVVSLLLLSLLGACSSTRIGGIGPHRIDIQQGNALDQENVAKLKPGLTRSQVRFLLGTPLLVDPFHNNRWDYVYTFHKAGKLTEQKRITLFFDNDVLQRMEGDIPVAETTATASQPPAAAPLASAAPAASKPAAAESAPVELAKKPEPVVAPMSAVTPAPAPASEAASTPAPRPANPAPTVAAAPVVPPAPVSAAASATPGVSAPARSTAPQATSATTATVTTTAPSSVVAPLPGAAASASAAKRPASSDLQLHPETSVAQIKPDVIPPFPDPNVPPAAKATEASVLTALQAWADAWAKANADAYIAAYAPDYAPAGDTHAAWEKRRRGLLSVARNVDLRIEAPKVKLAADGHALVTFKQYYRSANARDDLVKQLKFAQRDGRWVIVEEQVVSTLQAPRL